MLIGYARVSTGDQNLELQSHALNGAGVERLFTDKMSGVKVSRPGLDEAIAFARPGDVLVVWKLDRLGRSMKGLVDLAAKLESKGVDLRSLTDGIDTKTASGRFFFNVMAALATMERDLMLERTKAGLAVARRAGRVGGRKPKMTKEKFDAARVLLDSNTPPKDVAATMGISLSTLYRHLPASRKTEGG